MLRIEIEEQGEFATIHVEGKLAGDWVGELERCCRHELAHRQKGSLTLELDAVSFIDATGQVLLENMHEAGATLRAKGALSRYLVDRIQQRRTG